MIDPQLGRQYRVGPDAWPPFLRGCIVVLEHTQEVQGMDCATVGQGNQSFNVLLEDLQEL